MMKRKSPLYEVEDPILSYVELKGFPGISSTWLNGKDIKQPTFTNGISEENILRMKQSENSTLGQLYRMEPLSPNVKKHGLYKAVFYFQECLPPITKLEPMCEVS